ERRRARDHRSRRPRRGLGGADRRGAARGLAARPGRAARDHPRGGRRRGALAALPLGAPGRGRHGGPLHGRGGARRHPRRRRRVRAEPRRLGADARRDGRARARLRV
ncbi:MAG: hypothetical protein AVDCRST_MAG30-2874, partial [uncultured Solirubrobacteraceae bacterium]